MSGSDPLQGQFLNDPLQGNDLDIVFGESNEISDFLEIQEDIDARGDQDELGPSSSGFDILQDKVTAPPGQPSSFDILQDDQSSLILPISEPLVSQLNYSNGLLDNISPLQPKSTHGSVSNFPSVTQILHAPTSAPTSKPVDEAPKPQVKIETKVDTGKGAGTASGIAATPAGKALSSQAAEPADASGRKTKRARRKSAQVDTPNGTTEEESTGTRRVARRARVSKKQTTTPGPTSSSLATPAIDQRPGGPMGKHGPHDPQAATPNSTSMQLPPAGMSPASTVGTTSMTHMLPAKSHHGPAAGGPARAGGPTGAGQQSSAWRVKLEGEAAGVTADSKPCSSTTSQTTRSGRKRKDTYASQSAARSANPGLGINASQYMTTGHASAVDSAQLASAQHLLATSSINTAPTQPMPPGALGLSGPTKSGGGVRGSIRGGRGRGRGDAMVAMANGVSSSGEAAIAAGAPSRDLTPHAHNTAQQALSGVSVRGRVGGMMPPDASNPMTSSTMYSKGYVNPVPNEYLYQQMRSAGSMPAALMQNAGQMDHVVNQMNRGMVAPDGMRMQSGGAGSTLAGDLSGGSGGTALGVPNGLTKQFSGGVGMGVLMRGMSGMSGMDQSVNMMNGQGQLGMYGGASGTPQMSGDNLGWNGGASDGASEHGLYKHMRQQFNTMKSFNVDSVNGGVGHSAEDALHNVSAMRGVDVAMGVEALTRNASMEAPAYSGQDLTQMNTHYQQLLDKSSRALQSVTQENGELLVKLGRVVDLLIQTYPQETSTLIAFRNQIDELAGVENPVHQRVTQQALNQRMMSVGGGQQLGSMQRMLSMQQPVMQPGPDQSSVYRNMNMPQGAVVGGMNGPLGSGNLNGLVNGGLGGAQMVGGDRGKWDGGLAQQCGGVPDPARLQGGPLADMNAMPVMRGLDNVKAMQSWSNHLPHTIPTAQQHAGNG